MLQYLTADLSELGKVDFVNVFYTYCFKKTISHCILYWQEIVARCIKKHEWIETSCCTIALKAFSQQLWHKQSPKFTKLSDLCFFLHIGVISNRFHFNIYVALIISHFKNIFSSKWSCSALVLAGIMFSQIPVCIKITQLGKLISSLAIFVI